MTRAVLTLGLISLLLAGLSGCGPTAPEAAFSAIPLNGYAPEEVQFTDLSEGNVTSWEWDFDSDGVVDSILQNPTHLFGNPGNYTVSLTVDGSGGNSTEVRVDYLQFIPCPRFADFVADPTEMSGRHPIQFTDLSSSTSGNVTSWKWDFDSDGKIDSTEQNPQHTYNRNGLYAVSLTVTTPECDDTLTKHDYIKVTGCST
jgi:PKD repeat protein